MKRIELIERQEPIGETKVGLVYSQLSQLLSELDKKEMPDNVIDMINQEIRELNSTTLTGKPLVKLLKSKQTKILKLVEKQLNYVPKNHFLSMWLALGIGAFGLPIGLIFGATNGNMALLGLGLPIGVALGLALGNRLDKKAAEEGRQLNIELKH